MREALSIFLKYILPFIVAYILNLILNKYLSKELLRGKLHLMFLKGIITAVIWAAAVFYAMAWIPAFSKTWETAIASSGIAAVVLGLAAQSTLANVFAGIALSASRSRPFDIGEKQVSTLFKVAFNPLTVVLPSIVPVITAVSNP